MIEIESTSYNGKAPFISTFDPPYLNLMPIVEALVAHGNSAPLANSFAMSQSGWICVLTLPIDFEIVRSTFILPETISLNEPGDSILDTGSWCVILGPGAPGWGLPKQSR
jgi:hypothetical protein